MIRFHYHNWLILGLLCALVNDVITQDFLAAGIHSQALWDIVTFSSFESGFSLASPFLHFRHQFAASLLVLVLQLVNSKLSDREEVFFAQIRALAHRSWRRVIHWDGICEFFFDRAISFHRNLQDI